MTPEELRNRVEDVVWLLDRGLWQSARSAAQKVLDDIDTARDQRSQTRAQAEPGPKEGK